MASTSQVVEYMKNALVQRAVVYCLLVLSSLFLIVPLGILQTTFDGRCLLYSDVVYEYYNTSAGVPHSVLFRVRFGPQSVCVYCLAVCSLFSLLYSGVMAAVHVLLLCRQTSDRQWAVGKVVCAVHGVVEVVVLVLMLVVAGTVTHGFAWLCSGISHTGLPAYQVHSCSEAQRHNWRGYDASSFHDCLSVATAGSWLQVVLWLVQAALAVRKLWTRDMMPWPPRCLKSAPCPCPCCT